MRCLIVDSHPVTLLGFRSLLQSNFSQWRILTSISLEDAAQQIADSVDQRVDIVLLDLILLGESGVTFLSRLRNASVVVISATGDPGAASMCQRLGLNAFVSKESRPEDIVRAVRCASSGQTCFRLPGDAAVDAPDRFRTLTNRQRDLVDLLLIGCSNKVIASTLNLSYGTVKNYMFDLMRLLSVRSRLELVAKIREGMLLMHSSTAGATSPHQDARSPEFT